MPMSSPIMTTILGCFAPAACAWAVVPPPASMKLEWQVLPTSVVELLHQNPLCISDCGYCWVGLREGRIAMGEHRSIRGSRPESQQNSPKCYAIIPSLAKHIPAFVTVASKTSGQGRNLGHPADRCRHARKAPPYLR